MGILSRKRSSWWPSWRQSSEDGRRWRIAEEVTWNLGQLRGDEAVVFCSLIVSGSTDKTGPSVMLKKIQFIRNTNQLSIPLPFHMTTAEFSVVARMRRFASTTIAGNWQHLILSCKTFFKMLCKFTFSEDDFWIPLNKRNHAVMLNCNSILMGTFFLRVVMTTSSIDLTFAVASQVFYLAFILLYKFYTFTSSFMLCCFQFLLDCICNRWR